MKTVPWCLIACLVPSLVFAQGSLDPPPGLPGLTFKTLQQIEPRTDLRVLYEQNHDGVADDTTVEIIISDPGSYYLTSNLEVARTTGIFVGQFAGEVTIDLNGFRISRRSGTSGSGIHLDRGVAPSHCTVRNGSISGFSTGISFLSGASARRGGAYIDLVASSCTTGLSAGAGWRMTRCTAHDNTGAGIVASIGCSFSDCAAYKNGGIGMTTSEGSTLVNCTARDNQGAHGIQAGDGCTITACTAVGGGGNGITLGERSTVTGCTVAANGGDGILAGVGSTVALSTSSRNAGDGIETGPSANVRDCTLYENDGHGINASSGTVIRGCAARANQGNGIVVGGSGLISECVANLNGKKTSPNNTASDGIEINSGRTRVVNCTVFDNAGHGIHSTSTNNRNFIEGCLAHSNDAFGIFVQVGAGDTVIKNQVGGNSGGTINQSGGNIAPIQTASTAVGSIHPLANFP